MDEGKRMNPSLRVMVVSALLEALRAFKAAHDRLMLACAVPKTLPDLPELKVVAAAKKNHDERLAELFAFLAPGQTVQTTIDQWRLNQLQEAARVVVEAEAAHLRDSGATLKDAIHAMGRLLPQADHEDQQACEVKARNLPERVKQTPKNPLGLTESQIRMLRWYDPSRRGEDDFHSENDLDESLLKDNGLLFREQYNEDPSDLITGQGRAYLARLELSDDLPTGPADSRAEEGDRSPRSLAIEPAR